ncbi:uncharacterized protein F5147DRAFT_779596 [Suillus discolor]|uniref:DUF6533 domain-containing protein n=1 Tax=Suillus discolor TaxID=1912936 RepID=A0A9P7EWV0_9AGAM|nr:uncharacterized protein F5147DRAFT_779596 [Suillus discolor]KAG2092658.1 hypothetical protein F5147DRAFT_779596 [Suillus discolor]
MTLVSNSPNMRPYIEFDLMESYYVVIGSTVASTVVVIYDWALTFEREVELVWLRYGGIIYAVLDMPANIPTVYVTDGGRVTFSIFLIECIFFNFEQWCIFTIANIILGVIMITRLHAMYQRSRKMLIFLVVFFLTVTITSGVITVIRSIHLTGEELVLSGAYQCSYEGDSFLLSAITWILGTVWEALVLYLSVRIAIKHFRERPSTGLIIEDCFTVLIKSHVFYFASFVAVAALYMSLLSPNLRNGISAEDALYHGVVLLSSLLQMFLLGPRLILSVREHSTRLVDDSDGATAMTTIAFQERTPVSTNSDV